MEIIHCIFFLGNYIVKEVNFEMTTKILSIYLVKKFDRVGSQSVIRNSDEE